MEILFTTEQFICIGHTRITSSVDLLQLTYFNNPCCVNLTKCILDSRDFHYALGLNIHTKLWK